MSEPTTGSAITVVVKELTVHVVTGPPSEDPYGQGFSVISADAVVDDAASIARLTDAKEKHLSVTLRCAMLDVTGPITKVEPGPESHKFVVAVKDLLHRKPKEPWEDPVRLRRRGSGP